MSTTTRILAFASLLILAVFATLWTNAAYNLARWGWTVSGSLGDATFLLFPTPPRGVLAEIIVAMSPTDLFIYVHLLKTGALTALCLLLWAFVVFIAAAILIRQKRLRTKPG